MILLICDIHILISDVTIEQLRVQIYNINNYMLN